MRIIFPCLSRYFHSPHRTLPAAHGQVYTADSARSDLRRPDRACSDSCNRTSGLGSRAAKDIIGVLSSQRQRCCGIARRIATSFLCQTRLTPFPRPWLRGRTAVMGLRLLGWLRPVGRVGGPPVRHGITTNTFRLETRKLPTWLFVRRLSRISRSGSALGGVDRRPPTGSHKLCACSVTSHVDSTPTPTGKKGRWACMYVNHISYLHAAERLSDMPVEPKTVYSHEDRTIIVL